MCSPVDRSPTSVSHHQTLGEHHERGGQKIFKSQTFRGTAVKECLLDMVEPWPGGIPSDCDGLHRHVRSQDHQEFYMDGGGSPKSLSHMRDSWKLKDIGGRQDVAP